MGGKGRPAGRHGPQGGVVSPLLANVYIESIPEALAASPDAVKRSKPHVVAYADDFVILSRRACAAEANWAWTKAGDDESLG